MRRLAVLILLVGCDRSGSTPPAGGEPTAFTLQNHGGDMEGHTPRGFRGKGTGLFVGDNINAKFPENDGTQAFVCFDVSKLAGPVASATLRNDHARTRGAPFQDLGALHLEEIEYAAFSADLWDRAPVAGGLRCELAASADAAFECDVTDAVERAREAGRQYVQFRLRLDRAGDGDGEPDIVTLCPGEMNVNKPGCFELVGTTR